MSDATLKAMARHGLAHLNAGTMELAAATMGVPAGRYADLQRLQREQDTIHRRLPLVVAASCELPEPGSYKTVAPLDVPVLLTRDDSGQLCAFLNSCAHRGAQVARGAGRTRAFMCPFHGWRYNLQGDVIAVASAHEFGPLPAPCPGLQPLPVDERAGLIWVTLQPGSPLELDTYLGGIEHLLAEFQLQDWQVLWQRTLPGPSWKLVWEGYLDLYHLPVLHRSTFGPARCNQANYFAWGPHQRVLAPDRFLALRNKPESEWTRGELLVGIWTLFPNAVIHYWPELTDNGPKMRANRMTLSLIWPGADPNATLTTQIYLARGELDARQRAEAERQFSVLRHVVENEDYPTGWAQQQALQHWPAERPVLLGRNELGLQRFHRWVERLLNTPDAELAQCFDPRQAAQINDCDLTPELPRSRTA